MPWLDDPVAAAVALPPLFLAVFVFASALIEYLFPPYWGDTFVLLGFFLAGQGAVAPVAVFAAAMAGSVLGSIAAYQLGSRYGLAVTGRLVPKHRRSAGSRRLPALFSRFGEKLLLVNRFLPVVRGVMLYAAGAMKLPIRPVVFYCTLSNLAFVSLLAWAGLWTAGSWPEIQAVFRQSNRWLAAAAVAVAGAWLAVALWRRRFGVSSGESDTGSPTASERDEGDR